MVRYRRGLRMPGGLLETVLVRSGVVIRWFVRGNGVTSIEVGSSGEHTRGRWCRRLSWVATTVGETSSEAF